MRLRQGKVDWRSVKINKKDSLVLGKTLKKCVSMRFGEMSILKYERNDEKAMLKLGLSVQKHESDVCYNKKTKYFFKPIDILTPK